MADKDPRPFWHLPAWRHLGHFLLLGLFVGAWFVLVYGGADWFTSQHDYRVRVHLAVDLAVPFVPAAVLGYMALYPLFWAAPFILRTEHELQAMAATLCMVILVAGVCFLVLPAEIAFPPTPDCGPWEDLVRFAKRLALANNLVPSLHVAMSVVCAAIYAFYAGALGRAILWLWAGVIALSTMLLHQHYVIDVVTGMLLGVAGVRWIYCRRMLTVPRNQEPRG